tara:strand:+ start:39194 stop:39733 length:540 start_codon:yes stop_codon:yes gene_type:complete
MKKTILTLATIIAFNVNAQDTKDSGYLDSNNILSSFAFELSKNLAVHLTEEEKEKYNNFKENINNKLNSSHLLQKIYFKTDTHDINEKSLNYLYNMISALDNYQNLNYELTGYADNRGTENYNLNLAKKRIETIKELLINFDIPKRNISTINKGESEAKSYENVEDYFYDRKVEIKITQ